MVKLFCLLLIIISINSYAISFKVQDKKNCNEELNTDQVLTCDDYKKLN